LFERFLRDFQDSPSRVTAVLGVAACLDAQGKKAEATAKYQDIVQRFGSDPGAAPAKSALARLLEENNPSQALALYQELARSEQNTSLGLESLVRMQNLVAKHPDLLKPTVPVTAPTTPAAKAP
jgi:hypothetical protein